MVVVEVVVVVVCVVVVCVDVVSTHESHISGHRLLRTLRIGRNSLLQSSS